MREPTTNDTTLSARSAPMLSVEEARRLILAALEPVAEEEGVPLESALGRVLVADLSSPLAVPPFANSAMDGYALRGGDLAGAGNKQFRRVGAALAGHPFTDTLDAGECVRIMTGAPLPAGADTVIMQEQAVVHGDMIEIGAEHGVGENVRYPGEDINAGECVLSGGRRLSPADLGLIAGLGLARVQVTRRLRVAYFATGDELVPPGQALAPGQIHERNGYTTGAMLSRLGVDILDLGIIPDDPAAVRAAMLRAASADAVVTSGGVSVGDTDYVKSILEELGEISFWKVAVKPGKPLAFGRVHNAWFFGLPGNPVSAMVTFYLFVQPALRALSGERQNNPPPSFHIRCTSPLNKSPGREEYQRAIMCPNGEGVLEVTSVGAQGSAILTSMSRANCFIKLPAEAGDVDAGRVVEVIPFEGLV